MQVACVVPCFRGGDETLEVINKLCRMDIIDLVILVDDCCPKQTGLLVLEKVRSNGKVKVLFTRRNIGVGGATKKGINYAYKRLSDIIVKIDADGQMDPALIADLIKPIISGKVDAAKGNRFTCIDNIISMPPTRIVGNLGLSFLNKLSTGYWELFDPTNGFIAFNTSALKRVRLDKVDNRYFFESDLLFQCALAQITFVQLPMKSVYGNELSSLRPMREITRFAGKHLINFFKRLAYQYFVLDFNAGSLDLIGGFLGLLVTTIFSIKLFISGFIYKQYATSGEASLFAVLAILSTQMFIGFLYYDATQKPLLRQVRK